MRTLTLAYKELDATVYDAWKEKHYEASISLENRDDKLHDVYELIEVSIGYELSKRPKVLTLHLLGQTCLNRYMHL